MNQLITFIIWIIIIYKTKLSFHTLLDSTVYVCMRVKICYVIDRHMQRTDIVRYV